MFSYISNATPFSPASQFAHDDAACAGFESRMSLVHGTESATVADACGACFAQAYR